MSVQSTVNSLLGNIESATMSVVNAIAPTGEAENGKNENKSANQDNKTQNAYATGNAMASTLATQRVQSEQEKRKAQIEALQKAMQNIYGGGNA